MYTLLMLLSALAVLAFVAVLVVYVLKIVELLQQIGGSPTSLLAKLRLGLRAIETETGHLPPLLGKLNSDLSAAAQGLGSVEGHLEKTIEAALAQEGSK